MRPQALFKLLVCLSLILLLVVGLLRLLDREGILVLENFLLTLGRQFRTIFGESRFPAIRIQVEQDIVSVQSRQSQRVELRIFRGLLLVQVFLVFQLVLLLQLERVVFFQVLLQLLLFGQFQSLLLLLKRSSVRDVLGVFIDAHLVEGELRNIFHQVLVEVVLVLLVQLFESFLDFIYRQISSLRFVDGLLTRSDPGVFFALRLGEVLLLAFDYVEYLILNSEKCWGLGPNIPDLRCRADLLVVVGRKLRLLQVFYLLLGSFYVLLLLGWGFLLLYG